MQWYREIVNAVGDGVYEIDAEGRFCAVNDVIVETSGYSREELVGEPASKLLDEEGVRRMQSVIEELAAAGGEGVASLEVDVKNADGELVPAEFRVSALVEDGEYLGSVGVVRDVSERRRTERRLARSRQKIRALHDAATDVEGCATVDAACGRTVRAAEDVLEFDNCAINVEEDGLLEVAATSSNVPESEVVAMSVEEGLLGWTYRNGESRLVEDLQHVPEADPQGPYRSAISVPIGDLGVFQAVSERTGTFDEEDLELTELLVAHAREAISRIRREQRLREREAALRRERDLTERILDTSPVATAVVDTDGEIRRANRRVGDLLGLPVDELVGNDVREITFRDPSGEELPFRERPIARVLETGEPVHDVEARIERQTGDGSEEVWGSISEAPLVDDDGEVYAVIVAGEDVTERKERERELQRQRDELTVLNRINAVIRDVDRALVSATTREEIEAAVCERLTETDAYRFAWIGATRGTDPEIRPRASAGDSSEFLDRVTASITDSCTDRGPAGATLRTGEPQVVRDVGADPACDPWHEEALDRGYATAVGIPLRYEETIYGVLTVYAERPDAFDDRERAVLAELGENVGHAIDAVESKKLLLADAVQEVEFRTTDADSFFISASDCLDCRLVLDRVVPTRSGGLLYYERLRGADPDAVVELADEEPAIERARVIDSSADEVVIEFTVTGRSLVRELTERGARVLSARADRGDGHVVCELAPEADLGELVRQLRETFPDVQLVSKREVDRQVRTFEEFREEALRGRLTERQRAALETAYYAGYFEWPRDSTAETVASSLEVSSPTLHYHLRKAQRKVLSALFEGDGR